jgi:hypothetical protein
MKRLSACAIVVVVLAACGGGPEQPGEAAFNQADSRLSDNNTTFAFGNGPAGEQLAEKFNLRMKLMLKIGFTKRGPTGTTVDDNIVTHVNLTDDKVVFLVNVPGLRNFKEDAQDILIGIAWTIAGGMVERLEPKRDLTLAVGLRGIALYGASAFGPATAEKPDTKTHTGIVSSDEFYPFFTGAYPQDVKMREDSSTTATAAPAAEPAPEPPAPAGTVTEIAEPGDRVTRFLGLLGSDTTGIAVAPDLFITADTVKWFQGTMRLPRGPGIVITKVATLNDRGLLLFRVLNSFKFDPIPLSTSAPQAGSVVTTYFGAFKTDDVNFEVRKFTSNITSVGESIHTDQRLDVIPAGGALVDEQGRLIGIATSRANVYATVADIRRAIAEPRTDRRPVTIR